MYMHRESRIITSYIMLIRTWSCPTTLSPLHTMTALRRVTPKKTGLHIVQTFTDRLVRGPDPYVRPSGMSTVTKFITETVTRTVRRPYVQMAHTETVARIGTKGVPVQITSHLQTMNGTVIKVIPQPPAATLVPLVSRDPSVGSHPSANHSFSCLTNCVSSTSSLTTHFFQMWDSSYLEGYEFVMEMELQTLQQMYADTDWAEVTRLASNLRIHNGRCRNGRQLTIRLDSATTFLPGVQSSRGWSSPRIRERFPSLNWPTGLRYQVDSRSRHEDSRHEQSNADSRRAKCT